MTTPKAFAPQQLFMTPIVSSAACDVIEPLLPNPFFCGERVPADDLEKKVAPRADYFKEALAGYPVQ
jgi:hypothetical protein